MKWNEGFRAPIVMEDQMDKIMEDEVESRIIYGFSKGAVIPKYIP